MAVHRTGGEIPTGAVILSESDAITYQWKLLLNWTPKQDVWPFRYGPGIIGVCSALSGIYINNHYRNKLHLHNHGRFASYLPIVVLPAIMSTVFHQQHVTNDVIINKTRCPVCVELRSAAIQGGFSTVYPLILAPLAGFMFATRHYTYNIPSVIHSPAEVLALWQKLTRPVGNTLFGICVLQAFVAMWLTYYEAKSCHKVQAKMYSIEEEYEQMQHKLM